MRECRRREVEVFLGFMEEVSSIGGFGRMGEIRIVIIYGVVGEFGKLLVGEKERIKM